MSIYSYMLTILGIVFWLFRAVITAMYTAGTSFPIEPLNTGWEIALLFASIPCIILVLRRNVIGAALYVAVYVSYFGTALYNSFNHVADPLNVSGQIDIIMSIIGIVIPVLTFIDVWLNKHRKALFSKKSTTDWYYTNKEYDRQLDERADKNQYKIR
ncbi:MAG: hypothetical protein IJ867_08340 [Clostridia bacterium]|nr:hypothetical protein [Clostridia bacterium]